MTLFADLLEESTAFPPRPAFPFQGALADDAAGLGTFVKSFVRTGLDLNRQGRHGETNGGQQGILFHHDLLLTMDGGTALGKDPEKGIGACPIDARQSTKTGGGEPCQVLFQFFLVFPADTRGTLPRRKRLGSQGLKRAGRWTARTPGNWFSAAASRFPSAAAWEPPCSGFLPCIIRPPRYSALGGRAPGNVPLMGSYLNSFRTPSRFITT